MQWIRIRSEFARYPSGGPPPRFDITSDDDGIANVEIAVRSELLAAPVSTNPPEFLSSLEGSINPAVAGVQITLSSGSATWELPREIWETWQQLGIDRLYFRVVGSSTSGAPVFTSITNEDCLRGAADALIVLPQSAYPQVTPLVVPSDALAEVSIFERLFLVWISSHAGSADHRVLAEILAHETFTQAETRQQAQVLGLFALTNSPGRADVLRLLDTQVQVGSNLFEPAMFKRDERNEGTTVEHLLGLRDARLHRRVRARRSQILREALREVVDPGGEINQGNAGTCTVTSLCAYTTARNPAEFARWLHHLFDADHRHRCQLAKGGYLRMDTRAFSRTTWPGQWSVLLRSYTERVLQAALMDFGNFRFRYDPRNDDFRLWLTRQTGSGLWEFEVTRLFESVFNQPFVWGFGGGTRSAPNRQAATTTMFNHFAPPGGLPALITMDWGTGGHAVVALRVEGTEMIVRNPQYRGGDPVSPTGTVRSNPTRRIHRANRAEEAIDQSVFNATLIGCATESGQISDFGYTAAEIPSHLHPTVNPTNP